MSPGELVVITGGCGFIGTNLTLKLLASGVRVRTFDNLTVGEWSPVLKSSAEVMVGDVRDRDAVRAALAGASKAVHLAAFGSVIESVRDPAANFDVNVTGTLNVLQACVSARVGKLVFASTGGAALGEHAGPVNETVVPKPISPYGASKAAAEMYCHAFAKAYGLRTVSLRFANIYGPYSHHKTGAITRFLQALLEGRPIEVFGDGKATRDFLYVNDLCDAIARTLTIDVEPGLVLHLASGVETSINDLLQLVLQTAEIPGHPVRRLAARVGEVRKNVASYQLAHSTLGFSPSTDLQTGIALTWNWFRNGSI